MSMTIDTTGRAPTAAACPAVVRGPVGVEVGGEHGRPGIGQRESDRPADPRSRSGDDGDPRGNRL
jgi:hypothetical protein